MSRFIRRISRSSLLRLVFPLALGISAVTLAGCGGGGKVAALVVPAPVVPAVVVHVTMGTKTATLGVNDSQIFKATATGTGTTNFGINWSVTEASGGTIDSAGKYTAAAKAGTYHVVATSQALSTASDNATVTVTAPAPAFTSVPTSATPAVEGAVYSYALTTDLPATFALTGAPVGAGISGGTVSWTPASAQSRVSNSFTVTATTAAGGTRTQSWTVNPSGTITISAVDTYWSQGGSATSPNNLSEYTISALVLDPITNTYTISLPGTLSDDGFSVAIAGVPSGNYWLANTDGWGDVTSYWTNSSTFDLGADYSGRNMSSVVCNGPTNFNLNLTVLDSTEYNLQLTVPNQSRISWLEQTDSTNFMYWPCLDLASEDVAYISQQEWFNLGSGFAGSSSGPAVALPSLAAATGPTPVPAALARVNPQSFHVTMHGDAWAANFNNVSASTARPSEFGAQAFLQPFVSDRATSPVSGSSEYRSTVSSRLNSNGLSNNGGIAGVPLWNIYSYSGAMSSNLDAGTVEYNNPYPQSWLPVYGAYENAYILDNNEDSVSNMYATTTIPTGGFTPIMSAIQSPMMNGASLFTAASSTTTSVALSWTAPTGLTPAGYEIYYWCRDTCPDNGGWGLLYTTSTSLTLPPGLLTAGYSYVFEIGAIADSRANYNSSPNRSGYPQAYADVLSAPLFITSSDSGTDMRTIQGQAAVSRLAKKNVIRTANGSFLMTAKGNKPLDVKAKMLARFGQHSNAQASKVGPVVK